MEFFIGFLVNIIIFLAMTTIYSRMYLAKLETIIAVEDRLNERVKQANSRILKLESEVMYLKMR